MIGIENEADLMQEHQVEAEAKKQADRACDECRGTGKVQEITRDQIDEAMLKRLDDDARCDDYPEDRCTNPEGHEFECTGTAYGGDDERWHGEGRCLCIFCGADGDA